MATIDIAQFSNLIRSTSLLMQKAKYQGILTVTEQAAHDARINSTKQFTGRREYTLSGRLLNSIKSRYERKGDDISSYVGSYGIPYASIHEHGGIIKPKNWKYLWMRLPATTVKGSEWRRLAPYEFYKRAKAKVPGYYYAKSKKGNTWAMYDEDPEDDEPGTPLFWLRKSVKMPKRPFLKPAIVIAKKDLPITINQIFLNYLRVMG